MNYQELMNEAKDFWNSQKKQHFDADDVDWITVNGAHIPLDDDGVAKAGGQLKGKNFSQAKSQKSSASKGKAPEQQNAAEKSGSKNTKAATSPSFSAAKLKKKSLKSITKEDAEALRESIVTRHEKAQAEYDKACAEAEKEIASKITPKTMPHEKSKIERAAYSKANAIAQKYTNESADDFECVDRIGDNSRKVGEGAASVNDDIYYNDQYRRLKVKK